MRIGSVTMDNYKDLLRLFSDAKQGRLTDIKQRVRTESGNWDFSLFNVQQRVQGPMGRSMTAAEWDNAMAALDPNHIKGLVTVSGVNGVGGPPPPRMINLPEHMVQGIQDLVRLQHAQLFSGAREGSMKHADEMGMLQRSFVRDIPQQDRLDAMFTMHRIAQAERLRIESAVKQAMPNWQRGMRVPEDIKTAILSGKGGFDTTI